MITEDFVSFESAKLLKEKGFDAVKCQNSPHFSYNIDGQFSGPSWDSKYNAPTLQMAMKWLRTIHNIDIETPTEVGILGTKVYVPMISIYKNRKDAPEKLAQVKFGIYYKDDKGGVSALKYYKTKEEACEAAIRYCLEYLLHKER